VFLVFEFGAVSGLVFRPVSGRITYKKVGWPLFIVWRGGASISRLVLDESIDVVIEEKLEGRGVDTVRAENGISDQEVMQYAIGQDALVLTRDQGDYVQLDAQLEHPGILIDKQMHLRDKALVAETVSSILEKHGEALENNVVFVSNFYGRF